MKEKRHPRTAMLCCLGTLAALSWQRAFTPTCLPSPAIAGSAQTLEAERHLGLGLDSGFLIVNRSPPSVPDSLKQDALPGSTPPGEML